MVVSKIIMLAMIISKMIKLIIMSKMLMPNNGYV